MVRELGPAATLESEVPNVTVTPPVGAGPVSVTVPVPEASPVKVVGIERLLSAIFGLTVTFADWLEAPKTARIVTVVVAASFLVFTWNFAEVAPLATVTEDGAMATFEFVLPNVTTLPPNGAGPVRVTVPVAEATSEAAIAKTIRNFLRKLQDPTRNMT